MTNKVKDLYLYFISKIHVTWEISLMKMKNYLVLDILEFDGGP